LPQSDFEKSDRRLAPAALFFILCYFLRLTRHALVTGFSSDDLMNLHRSWYFPLSALVKANLLFFLPSDFIRPMGSLWYRAIYYFAGFRGGPFHAVHLAILLVNIFLTYSVARRLSGSRLAALTAALLSCYRRNSEPLYFDTGYIYDALCYFFMFAALLWYIAIRQRSRAPGVGETVALLALFVCALNSKEMAVALPVVLALYEWLYERRRSLRPLIIMGLMTAVFIAFRTGDLAVNRAYQTVYTWARFMQTNGQFLNELLVTQSWFTPALVVAFWTALLLIAAGTKSKPLLFAWAFTMVTALPIAFVLPRGSSQYYIPTFGCALYAGCALAALVKWLLRAVRAQSYWVERAAAACLLLAIGWPLYTYYQKVGRHDVYSMSEESPVWMSLAANMRSLRPTLPPDARVLFLNDPMLPNVEDMLFLVRLNYRDRSLEVDRAKRMPQPPSARQMQAYDAVFDYQSGRLSEVPQPAVTIHPAMLGFFDADWKAITANHPAHPGDRIITKAADLGPTDPEVAPGTAFPPDPFAESILRPSVRVNGRLAEVPQHFGSPGEVNIYRFDFRIPPQTQTGMARVQLTVGGHSAPPAAIPVSDNSTSRR
jgi:hypothetical protein